MGKIRSYKDLIVWQRAVEYCVHIYRVTEDLPASESFGLTNQMRRAAVSIPSNIAEGSGRTNKEFARYLKIALGSMAELETQIEITRRVGYISDDQCNSLSSEISSIGKQITVLHHKVIEAQ